jgi:hypothetical protein
MAHLIQEMHSSPAVVLGSSPPQGIGVGQAVRGKQAVTPEADQHSVAFFIQYDRIVEVTGGCCAQCEIKVTGPATPL